jgi:hypothetical protein
MSGVIIPKDFISEIHNPLIFLAGPIRSAPNWQDDVIEILFGLEPSLTIVSPRRGVRENLQKFLLKGDATHFHRQRAWERYYLSYAAHHGAILFWLPTEEVHDCNKVYGAMTRLELGQWMTNYRHDPTVRFCVGSDGGFPELNTIEYDLQLDAPNHKIYVNLEETCQKALDLCK